MHVCYFILILRGLSVSHLDFVLGDAFLAEVCLFPLGCLAARLGLSVRLGTLARVSLSHRPISSARPQRRTFARQPRATRATKHRRLITQGMEGNRDCGSMSAVPGH